MQQHLSLPHGRSNFILSILCWIHRDVWGNLNSLFCFHVKNIYHRCWVIKLESPLNFPGPSNCSTCSFLENDTDLLPSVRKTEKNLTSGQKQPCELDISFCWLLRVQIHKFFPQTERQRKTSGVRVKDYRQSELSFTSWVQSIQSLRVLFCLIRTIKLLHLFDQSLHT